MRKGSLLSALGVGLGVMLLVAPAGAVVYTVTNTSADRFLAGSLPWAVMQANYATPNALDYIKFNIPGAGPFVITIDDTLYLNDQVVVDATSQPGYAGTPLVHVHGDGSVNSLFLLQNDPAGGNLVGSSVSTIQGLEMFNFLANAVTIFNTSQGNWIQRNWIGFHQEGAAVSLNTGLGPGYLISRGLGIQSSWNTIRNNTISGVDNGITVGDDPLGGVTGPTYVTNSFSYNMIGCDPTGTTAAGYGNTSDGIFLGAGALEMWIGPGNVFSGMASSGVELFHSTNFHNIIFSNFIGTNASGTAAIPNGELGVLLTNGAHENAVGGPWGANVISGNGLGGVALGTPEWGGAHGNWVQYNIIGLTADQTAAIPGQVNGGIALGAGSTVNTVEGNVVAGNSSNGIVATNTVGNSLSYNYIGKSSHGDLFSNGDFGIVLLDGANQNWVVGNFFGSNLKGNIWVSPGAWGNAF